jgi:hypothetical protein
VRKVFDIGLYAAGRVEAGEVGRIGKMYHDLASPLLAPNCMLY